MVARLISKTGWILLAGSLVLASGSDPLFAQAGLRESLERLDRNEDGAISPNEVTPLARPFLERIAKARRLSLDKEQTIEKWQEAARIYYALQNGVAGTTVRPEGDSTVKEFGPDRDEPVVPEFGLAEVKYPYSLDDLREADRTLKRCDRNKDGYVDREEAVYGKWTHRDPFEMDLDGDGRLSRLELGQRYARRRLLSSDSSELVRKAQRVGNGIRPSEVREQDRSRSRGRSKDYLPSTVMGRFDANRNGRLELSEALELGIPLGQIDLDRNNELSRQELYAYLAPIQEELAADDETIPSWFYELDDDRDGQISMVEYIADWTDENVQEFLDLDANEDGLLTAGEITSSSSASGGVYANHHAEVLPPRKSVISEIEVTDDYLIGDLNVQLSITHTYASNLDAYLTGPDGQQVELFTAVGAHDDHFDQTILDDQASYPITKARPPFKGTFIPEGLLKRQPSLSHFNGKSIKGVWQLVIRCSRSERFGMLHGWSLIAKPQRDLPVGATVSTPSDVQQNSGSDGNAASQGDAD